MPLAGFECAIPEIRQLQNYTLYHAATGIGMLNIICLYVKRCYFAYCAHFFVIYLTRLSVACVV